MKKILFVILTAVILVNFSIAQLVKKEVTKEILIGKLMKGFSKFAELSYSLPQGNDTVYHLYYKDIQYSQLNEWKSVFFKGGSSTLNDLYITFKQAVDSPKGKETVFTLGDNDVLIKSSRLLGGKYLSISFTDNNKIVGLFNLDKNKIDELFGIKFKDDD